jgi:chromate transporter
MTVESQRPLRVKLHEIALVALRNGLLGFGGGFAVIGRMKQSFVDRRAWVSPGEFVEAVAVATALPGTASANVFTVLGSKLGGLRAAATVTTAFILPSALLMVLFAALYPHAQRLAAMRWFMDGMNAAVVGVIAAVAVDMAREVLRAPAGWAIALGAALALAMRWLTLVEVVLLAAALGVATTRRSDPHAPPPSERALAVFPPVAALSAVIPASALLTLFVVFAKIGLVTFGGGLAMIPGIAHEVIPRGWIDESTFADAIAFGQITPGPVSIAATFIGYRAAGPLGALAATVGVFAPPFVVCALAARSMAAFKRSFVMRGILRGVSPAVVGIIAAAAWSLGRTSVDGWLSAAVAVAALVLRVTWSRGSPLIALFGGGFAGVAAAHLRLHF